MFTGIIQGQGKIVKIIEREQFRTHIVEVPEILQSGIMLGGSIANNGCCLTVTHVDGEYVSFDLMQETLRATNLGMLHVGNFVNLERAARFGDEIGGHAMSGHIMCTAEVTEIIRTPNNQTVWFKIPEEIQKYIMPKGYIGIDGISLTIGEVREGSFCVHLIPETLNRTNMGIRQEGESVNIEIDPQTQAIVETVERVLKNHPQFK